MNEAKKTSLDTICTAIDKKFGKGSVMHLTDAVLPDKSQTYDSGSIALNTALGIGGYPRGRLVEIYGPESSGKTTLCLEAIAIAQQNGITCAFLDAEQTLDPLYAAALGVDLEALLFCQPDYGEQALEIVDMFARSGEVGLIVVDSVAALIPQKELEGEMGDQFVGLHARLMSQAMRKLTGAGTDTGCTIIFTNQIRMKIGVMYGSPETTTGGNSLKFYASQRLEIRRGEQLKDGETIIGNRTKVKIVKNKMAPPFRTAEFDIIYGKGIDKDRDIMNCAIEDGAITKSGSWYSYGETRLGQGEDAVFTWLNENPEKKESIRTQIMNLRGLA